MNQNSETMKMIMNATENEGMVMANFFMELEMIKDPKIRAFTREVLVKSAPQYFWKVPASTSGKYHNPDECTESGLIKHVKRVVKMAHTIMVGLGWLGHKGDSVKEDKQNDYDIVISACILHDLFKAGFEGRERKGNDGSIGTDSLHPYYVREAIRMKKLGEDYFYKLPFFEDIMTAIEGHYGFWSVIPSTMNLSDAQSHEFIVYMADYIASRKFDELYKV